MQSRPIEIFYLFFQGVLTFQVLVFAALYFFTRRKELLFYCLFLFFAAVYFFINAPYTFFGISEDVVWDSAWYVKVNDVIIITQNLFYLLFLKSFFINIAAVKKVNKLFNYSLLFIPLLLITLSLSANNTEPGNILYYTAQLIPVIPAVFVAFAIIKNKFSFASLVANGLLFNVAGTLLTVFMNALRDHQVHHLFTDGYPLFFVRIGILADMIFFLAAILKKWHYQEQQLLFEKLQSQLVVEKLRNKISAELHDDIGSTLSGIKMYSYMINDYLQSGKYADAINSIDIIQRSAGEITNNLNDLVWTINPQSDSMQTLLERIEEYAKEMAAVKNMNVQIDIADTAGAITFPMDTRRNIYLFCKEAINNAVKYSGGNKLTFLVMSTKAEWKFSIQDNGKGFNEREIHRGNGLNNMQKRAEEIGAKFILRSNCDEGTSVSMQIKIT